MYSSPHRQARWLSAIVSLVSILLLGALIVSAQGDATPLTIGENEVGEITAANSSAAFSIQVGAPQSVNVQVLAITPGFPALLPHPRSREASWSWTRSTTARRPAPLARPIFPARRLSHRGQRRERRDRAVLDQRAAGRAAGAAAAAHAGHAARRRGQPANDAAGVLFQRIAQRHSAAHRAQQRPDADPAVTLRDADSGETLGIDQRALGRRPLPHQRGQRELPARSHPQRRNSAGAVHRLS